MSWNQSTTTSVQRDAYVTPVAAAPVTLTLYVHNGSATGPVLAGASVSGSDGGGQSFNQTTNGSGYVTITGTPGSWQFTASASGYNSVSWNQSTTTSVQRDAYVTPVAAAPVTLTLYVHNGSATGPVLAGASVSGSDGGGQGFNQTTNGLGYVTITGTPGSWQFTASASGYNSVSWNQSTTTSVQRDAYLAPTTVPVTAPTVITNAATNVTATSATLSGTITDAGGGAILEARIEWTPTASGFPGTVIYNVPVSGSTFFRTVTDLLPSTSYTFHVFAKNSAGFNTSTNNVSFTTSRATIPAVDIASPVSADTWIAGSTQTMQWRVTPPEAASQIGSFLPEYTFDGTNYTALPQTGSAAREASVAIPALVAPSTQARVRVTAYRLDGSALPSVTSLVFNIVAPSVTHPIARADTNYANPDWGQTVSFLGSGSADSNGGNNITSYAWDFGDGQSLSVADPAHAFQGSGSPRNITVKLTVTDFAGKTDTAALTLLVGSTRTSGTNNLQSQSKDPVNLATGNYSYEHVDLRLPGRGLPFEFKRFYNSKGRIDANGPLGPRWTHSYQLHIVAGTDGKVQISRGDGNTEAYALKADGSYQPEPGVHNRLVRNGDGTFSLLSKEQVRHDFDAQGRLAAITDRNANALSFHYSAAGVLDTATDSADRVIAFSADAGGHITGLTDPLNRTIAFTYDGAGDLVTSTDRRGKMTTFAYDADHQITQATDPAGNKFVRNEYDSLSRVVKTQKDALDGATVFDYNFQTRITTLTDALGNKSFHQHDDKLRVVAVTDPLGETERYEYDANNNRTRVIDKVGGITSYAYDLNGNVTAKVDAMGRRTSILYDARNNPTRRTDVLGRVTSFFYDVPGNLAKAVDPAGAATLYTYDAHGQFVRSVDPLLHETKREYDAQGNLSKVIDALTNATVYTYDTAGRRLSQQDALNRTSSFAYDEEGNLLTTTDAATHTVTNSYDDNGNRLTTLDARGNLTQFNYDRKDRLIQVKDALGNVTRHAYDALDRKIRTTDPLLHPTNWSYDGLGRVTKVTDARNNATVFTYDANSNQNSATDALGHVRWVQYDALNRPIRSGDPLGNVTRTDYDALGGRSRVFDANGRATAFAYDVIGRLVRVINAAGGTVRYTYDKAGNRLTMSDPKGYTTRYAYDVLNRRVEMREPKGGLTRTSYDAVGNRIGATDPKGQATTFTYDVLNRLVGVQYADSSVVSFTYDENGNRVAMTDSIGNSSWQYDVLNRMTSATDGFQQTIGYSYDADGNRRTLVYPGNHTVNYTYDEVNRLVSVQDWLSHTTTYTYDPVGNLKGTLNANGTTADYGYDDANRLTHLADLDPSKAVIASYDIKLDAVGNHREVDQQEPLEVTPPEETVNFTYDKDNRLLKANDVVFSYDANGNTTARGADTFTFDARDRLVATQIAGVASTYRYDGLGNRLERTAGGATTRYMIDSNGSLSRVLAETDATDALNTYYIQGRGLISRIGSDGSIICYHFDARGSTVALTDNAGYVTHQYAYDPFGKVSGSSGAAVNPFRYIGKYGVLDDGDGIACIRARYYMPSIARFISKDPMPSADGDSQGLHRYIYALNNPVKLIDISGWSPMEGSGSDVLGGSSDAAHRSLLEAQAKAARLQAYNAQTLAYEQDAIYYNAEADVLQGAYDALQTTEDLLTGNWLGGAAHLTKSVGTLLNTVGSTKAAQLTNSAGTVLEVADAAHGVYSAYEAAGTLAPAIQNTGINLKNIERIDAFDPVAKLYRDLLEPTITEGYSSIGTFLGDRF